MKLTDEDKKLWNQYTRDLQNDSSGSKIQQIQHDQINHETKIDLHGMTLQEAYDEALYFLGSCYENNVRDIIIITGHGDGENSIKREFQFWIQKQEFSSLIISCNIADRNHGGEGAFMLKIKKGKQ